jgi:hypothetical protein
MGNPTSQGFSSLAGAQRAVDGNKVVGRAPVIGRPPDLQIALRLIVGVPTRP